ncbi:Radixin [Exaiptasia diaphana]|nr:Radixin [Exaiptasia diaphana]
MPKNSPMNVVVSTKDARLELTIMSTTTGKQLFDQVVRTIGLREIWFFGLKYIDNKGQIAWVKLTKKISAHEDLKKANPMEFTFEVKFFPEAVEEELIQEVTKRLFFLQIKDAILNDEIYCPAETCILLASYACQAKYGDYQITSDITLDKLFPERIILQHELSKEEWINKIQTWWLDHGQMLKEDAMVEYLKLAQDLEMYGVNYFEIKNKKGTKLLLGVDALGLNIYEITDRLTPQIGFPWREIGNISFNDKKFTIKAVEKKAPDFVFFSEHLRINKRILALCMGNHELYLRRRKEDTIEVQQMRAQERERRDAILMDRKALKDREKANQETTREYLKLQEIVKQSEQEKEKIREENEKLQRQLELKAKLEKKLEELDKERAAERERLNQEKEQLRIESERKAKEAQRLKEENERKEREAKEIENESSTRAAILKGSRAFTSKRDDC